jgi:hypothetical protein
MTGPPVRVEVRCRSCRRLLWHTLSFASTPAPVRVNCPHRRILDGGCSKEGKHALEVPSTSAPDAGGSA